MNKIVVGIDPGNSGAIYALKNGVKFFSTTYPKLPNGDIDRAKLFGIFLKLRKHDEAVFVIERVHAIFNSSAAATFSFGRAVEMIDTMVTILKLRHFHVEPKEWQKVAWSGVHIEYKPPKANKPEGKKKARKIVDTKKTSDLAARKIFPDENYKDNHKTERSFKRHDGLIDASLIAWYGHLKGY